MGSKNAKGMREQTSKKPMEDFISKQKSVTQLEQLYNATVVGDPYVRNAPRYDRDSDDFIEGDSSDSVHVSNKVCTKAYRPTLKIAQSKS